MLSNRHNVIADRRKKLAANSAHDEGVYLIKRTDNQTYFDRKGYKDNQNVLVTMLVENIFRPFQGFYDSTLKIINKENK